jgi:hypothetical protein
LFESAAIQTLELVVDGNTMSPLASRPSDALPTRVRGKTTLFLFGFVAFTVFVLVVTTVAVADGTSAAVMTGLLMVAVIGMTVGLWGAAMAVRDTDELGWRRVEELSRAVAIRNAPSAR